MWTSSKLNKTPFSAASNLLAVVPAASKVVDVLANQLPLPSFLKRQAARSLKARVAWGVVPLLGLGAAVWGVQTWRRRQAAAKETASSNKSTPPLPLVDTKAPKDKLDESSWESFPASDPPATSGGKIKPMQVPAGKGQTRASS